eukprot:6198024-Pleurochrysis_carterae.AAC.2
MNAAAWASIHCREAGQVTACSASALLYMHHPDKSIRDSSRSFVTCGVPRVPPSLTRPGKSDDKTEKVGSEAQIGLRVRFARGGGSCMCALITDQAGRVEPFSQIVHEALDCRACCVDHSHIKHAVLQDPALAMEVLELLLGQSALCKRDLPYVSRAWLAGNFSYLLLG